MGPETPPKNFLEEEKENEQEISEGRGKTSRRLMAALRVLVETSIGSLDVRGKEYLKEIPPDKKVIIVPTHISDLDVPLSVYAPGKDFNIVIADQSVHHHLSKEPLTYIAGRIAGKESFLSITWQKNKSGKRGIFKALDFLPMKEALEEGKSVAIAAHNPSYDGKLTPKGGIGAVYAAEVGDALILPVAVNVKSKEPLGFQKPSFEAMWTRPDTEITIGKPIEFPHLEKDLLNEKMTREDLAELKKRSSLVMETLAAMLPPERRGEWGETFEEQNVKPSENNLPETGN